MLPRSKKCFVQTLQPVQVRRVICHLQLDITHEFRTSLARLGKKNFLGCYLLSYLRTHQKKVHSIGTHCLPHFQVMLMGWSIQYCVLFSYRTVSKPSMQCCDGHIGVKIIMFSTRLLKKAVRPMGTTHTHGHHTHPMGTTHSTWAPHTAHGHHTQHMGTTHTPWAPHTAHGHHTQHMGTTHSTWAPHTAHGHHTQHMGTTHSTWAPHTAHGHHTQHMGTTHSTFLEGHLPLLIMSEPSLNIWG